MADVEKSTCTKTEVRDNLAWVGCSMHSPGNVDDSIAHKVQHKQVYLSIENPMQ